jgi:peptidoglycan hydrolase CwlO-like protein
MMKIAAAQKKISRLKGEMKEIKKRISSCLNTIVENDYEDCLTDLMNLLAAKTVEMMSLKSGVIYANVKGNMFIYVLQLGELKSKIDFLRELEPKTGLQESHSYVSEKLTKYKSQLTVQQKNKMIQDIQSKINMLTDKLDAFNLHTEIESIPADLDMM